MIFDIVIPLGPNEKTRINDQIEFTKKNIVGFRNIYIVSCDKNIKIPGTIIIDEDIFPFKLFISKYFLQFNGKKNRNGWYFQQLIKLYAGNYIEGILDNYLVIDADVFFLKQTNFIDIDNKPIFTLGNQNHNPYFKHMIKLHENFTKSIEESGICHHMMYNKNYLSEIFDLVEEKHNKPFWNVFILSLSEHKKYITMPEMCEAGCSEYELYLNYMVKYHKDDIIIRNLIWSDISETDYNSKTFLENNDFVSVCAWMK
jgi:hypothetical protein